MLSHFRTSDCFKLLALLFLAAACSGCSISRAIRQPDKKDLTVLMPGNTRSEVIAEIGAPSYQENLEGTQRDVFSFRQGYTKPVKIGRAVGHGVALFSTFGLWEFAGYPIELALDGEDVRVQVDYDPSMRVTEVTYFRGGHLRENGPTLPTELYGGKVDVKDETVTLSRGPGGELVVTKGIKPITKTRDETHVAQKQGPEPVNEATYYSSSEIDRPVKASQTSGTKLR